MHISPRVDSGKALQQELDLLQEEYILGLRPELSPEAYKEQVKNLEKEIKSRNITLGVDLSKDELDKNFEQLIKDFKQKQQGTAFEIATDEVKNVENAQNNKERLTAIQNEMTANDTLIKSLQELINKYMELGTAGADSIEKITAQIQQLQERQTELSGTASVSKSSLKQQEKQEKNWKDITSSVGDFGNVLQSVGQMSDEPALNVAGTVAQSLANLALGASKAIAQSAEMGPFGWLAFSFSALAQLASMTAQFKSLTKYAQGGIVHGASKVGDRNLVRVNGGELITTPEQTKKLWDLVSGKNSIYGGGAAPIPLEGEVVVRGSDLILAIKNKEKINKKRGNKISIM